MVFVSFLKLLSCLSGCWQNSSHNLGSSCWVSKLGINLVEQQSAVPLHSKELYQYYAEVTRVRKHTEQIQYLFVSNTKCTYELCELNRHKQQASEINQIGLQVYISSNLRVGLYGLLRSLPTRYIFGQFVGFWFFPICFTSVLSLGNSWTEHSNSSDVGCGHCMWSVSSAFFP